MLSKSLCSKGIVSWFYFFSSKLAHVLLRQKRDSSYLIILFFAKFWWALHKGILTKPKVFSRNPNLFSRAKLHWDPFMFLWIFKYFLKQNPIDNKNSFFKKVHSGVTAVPNSRFQKTFKMKSGARSVEKCLIFFEKCWLIN